jgi:hypothetical protein
VTGPHKVNGVPLKRVSELSFYIDRSTKHTLLPLKQRLISPESTLIRLMMNISLRPNIKQERMKKVSGLNKER